MGSGNSRMGMRRWARWSAALVGAALSACNMTPEYERPTQEVGVNYRNAVPEPSPDMPRPLSRWWSSFGSDELDVLIEEALENNHDIKAATQRIAQAEAQAGSTASALLPSVSLTAKRSVDSPNGGQGTIVTPPTNKAHRLSAAGISASYEFDLWGKVRASTESSLASALANVHDRETIAITLVADLTNTYMQYLEGVDRERVARNNISNMRAMHAAVKERVRLGESSELELAQQRNILAQAEATVPPIVLQRERAFNKIAVLLGRAPDTLALNGKTLFEMKLPNVSPGLPADLLLRRPDVKKAEANLMAANANIGIARAKMFPTLSLTGERGWASQLADNFISPTSIYYTVASSLAATIFDNGKTQADIDYSLAKKAELVETYQQSILAALRDVEDALVGIRMQADLETAQLEVNSASLVAYNLSSEAFRLGMVDYLNVLETQRTRFQAEDAKVQARYGRFEALIGLYKALGGGMEHEDEAPPASAAAAPAPAAVSTPSPAPVAATPQPAPAGASVTMTPEITAVAAAAD